MAEKTRRAKRHAATPHIIPGLAESVDDEPTHAPNFLERGPALLTDAGHNAGRRFGKRLNFFSSSERLISRHDQRESASVRSAGKRKMAQSWCNRANRVKPPPDASLAQLTSISFNDRDSSLRMGGLKLTRFGRFISWERRGTGYSNDSYLSGYPWR